MYILLFVIAGLTFNWYKQRMFCKGTQVNTYNEVRIVESRPSSYEEAQYESVENISFAFFNLTDQEYELVLRTVIAEAGCESFEGQKAIAQCIRDTALSKQLTVSEVVERYKYAPPYKGDLSAYFEKASTAVFEVFVCGENAVEHRIMYFYAPKRVQSSWHESQEYITTIGNHRFFDER